MKKAFITGITGQDGSYLAELLLSKGYVVFGFVRKVSLEDKNNRLAKLQHILHRIHLIGGRLRVILLYIRLFYTLLLMKCIISLRKVM